MDDYELDMLLLMYLMRTHVSLQQVDTQRIAARSLALLTAGYIIPTPRSAGPDYQRTVTGDLRLAELLRRLGG